MCINSGSSLYAAPQYERSVVSVSWSEGDGGRQTAIAHFRQPYSISFLRSVKHHLTVRYNILAFEGQGSVTLCESYFLVRLSIQQDKQS